MIRSDIVQSFPDLFENKRVNGREVNIENTIATLTRELRPEIDAALNARRERLAEPGSVPKKYGWPKWDEKFEDPVTGQFWTWRQIVQGMIDSFLGRDT
ncbi:MAG: malate synthase, partial [Acidobacteria bacterium]|nr:malate synthase [Acidobacteriota bacterium]